jgi:D-tyrosyl-tRNA(Tyr) deacylase
MKAVIQRAVNASVTVEGQVVGAIESGLVVYVGVALGDPEADARWVAEKAVHLRIFEDDEGKMNRSVADADGNILAVSQFTLLADARKGRRPSYSEAAPPEEARRLYEYFVEEVRRLGVRCETGVFRARMDVSYTNEGPVTIILDSAVTHHLPDPGV